jgi:hypothetical protein
MRGHRLAPHESPAAAGWSRGRSRRASAVKLTKLQLEHVPRGSTVRLSCTGKGCPKALKKAYTKRKLSGTVSLAQFTKKPFKAGVKLKFVLSNPAWLTTTKTLTFRARKAPRIT